MHHMQLYKSKEQPNKNRKITKITPYEVNFGGKHNIAASNITTKPESNHLSNEWKIKYYLDEDTILGRSYLTDDDWADTSMCSDLEVYKVICALNARAHNRKRRCRTMRID